MPIQDSEVEDVVVVYEAVGVVTVRACLHVGIAEEGDGVSVELEPLPFGDGGAGGVGEGMPVGGVIEVLLNYILGIGGCYVHETSG